MKKKRKLGKQKKTTEEQLQKQMNRQMDSGSKKERKILQHVWNV